MTSYCCLSSSSFSREAKVRPRRDASPETHHTQQGHNSKMSTQSRIQHTETRLTRSARTPATPSYFLCHTKESQHTTASGLLCSAGTNAEESKHMTSHVLCCSAKTVSPWLSHTMGSALNTQQRCGAGVLFTCGHEACECINGFPVHQQLQQGKVCSPLWPFFVVKAGIAAQAWCVSTVQQNRSACRCWHKT